MEGFLRHGDKSVAGPLSGKWSVVTGACSGMGYRYACELASMGSHLVIVSNRDMELNLAADNIFAKWGVDVMPFCIDLSREDAAEALYHSVENRGIVPYVFINNAGSFKHSDFECFTPDDVRRNIMLNVMTPAALMNRFAVMMKDNGGGYILNMSSLASYFTFPGIGMYCAAKSYMRNLSKALWYEMKGSGVVVTSVAPGAVATDLYGLSHRYQKLGIALGIIARPEKVVHKALRCMFRGRRTCVPYAVLNRTFGAILPILPPFLVRFAYRLLRPIRIHR